MEWQSVGIPPEDAQFLQTREFQVVEIARWFRMPPHKVQHLAKAAFRNIEHQSIEYVVDTLLPWMRRWEQEINRKLIPAGQRPSRFVEHLVDGLLRGDSAARSKFYREMFMIGAMSPNEIRERENMNPIEDEGGDKFFVPLNMAPVDERDDDDDDGNNGRTRMHQTAPIAALKRAFPTADLLGELLNVHRPLLGDAITRVFRVEADKIKRASRRESDPTEWIRKFYEEHETYFRAGVGAAVDAAADAISLVEHGAALNETGRTKVMEWTAAMVRGQIARSREMLALAVNPASVVDAWEARAAGAADAWLTELHNLVRGIDT